MTCRAIIWCGAITQPRQRVQRRGKERRDLPAMERVIFRSDIELAIQAAQRRQVRPEDIWAFVCDEELLPETFAGRVYPATVPALQAAMKSIEQVATAEDHLIFIATNHGTAEGLLVETAPSDEFTESDDEPAFLSLLILQHCLEPILGQQILVIATCYAGIFLPLGSARRAILAVCGANKPYEIKFVELDPPRNPFLYELLSRWAGVSLANYAVPEPASMSEAFRTIEPDFEGCGSAGDASWPD